MGRAPHAAWSSESASDGGCKVLRYWRSKARKAASTVGPKPAIPSRTVRPRRATQTPERVKSRGRRTAEGLPGCAKKYNSIRSFTADLLRFLSLISYKNAGRDAGGFIFFAITAEKKFKAIHALFSRIAFLLSGGVLNAPPQQKGTRKRKGI
jgi:hypothetical protein